MMVQPCAALEDCRCTIYEDRPRHCRKFECLLLKRVQAGETRQSAALRTIRNARQQADRVLDLLRDLADTDEHLPLATRFRRTGKRLERVGVQGRSAESYQKVTLAMHELSLLLSREFYPGA